MLKSIVMTTEEARKILGDESTNIPDADIQKEIETAELFKNIFFSLLHEGKLGGLKKQK